jgi:hypothetical protein
VNKTKAINFKNIKKEKKIELKFILEKINSVEDIKFLGKYIDKKLNFNKELNSLIFQLKKNACNKFVFFIQKRLKSSGIVKII